MPYKVLHNFTFFGKKYHEGTILKDDVFTPEQFAGFVKFDRMVPVESLDKELHVRRLRKDKTIQAIVSNESANVDNAEVEENPGTE